MTTASAPASSANLGPGYDVLAIAVDLRCRVTVATADHWEVVSGGAPATPETMALIQGVLGSEPRRVVIESDIPQAAGLGSSAALLVATAAAGGIDDRTELHRVASDVEGHPDNVAAAVFGGLVAVDVTGVTRRLTVHPSWHIAVAIPAETLSTSEARSVLTTTIDRSVAARTASRIVALVEGLRTGDAGLLEAAGGDELHEAPRSALTPTPAVLMESARRAGAAHAAWSGAGPSVVAFADEDTIDDVVEALAESVGTDGRAFEATIDRTGVTVE